VDGGASRFASVAEVRPGKFTTQVTCSTPSWFSWEDVENTWNIHGNSMKNHNDSERIMIFM
jgi:hypothetical protein